MPNADAWTTFPKAPLPSDLPTIEEGLGLFAKPTASLSPFQEGNAVLYVLCGVHIFEGIPPGTDPYGGQVSASLVPSSASEPPTPSLPHPPRLG